jgi:hypothetical protein
MWPRSILRTAYTGYHICEILISTYSAVVPTSIHRVHGEETKSKSSTTMIALSVILPSVLPFRAHWLLLGSDKPFKFVRSCESYLSVLRVNERKSKRTSKKGVRDKRVIMCFFCFWVTPAYGVGYTKSYVAPYSLVVSVLKRNDTPKHVEGSRTQTDRRTFEKGVLLVKLCLVDWFWYPEVLDPVERHSCI